MALNFSSQKIYFGQKRFFYNSFLELNIFFWWIFFCQKKGHKSFFWLNIFLWKILSKNSILFKNIGGLKCFLPKTFYHIFGTAGSRSAKLSFVYKLIPLITGISLYEMDNRVLVSRLVYAYMSLQFGWNFLKY